MAFYKKTFLSFASLAVLASGIGTTPHASATSISNVETMDNQTVLKTFSEAIKEAVANKSGKTVTLYSLTQSQGGLIKRAADLGHPLAILIMGHSYFMHGNDALKIPSIESSSDEAREYFSRFNLGDEIDPMKVGDVDKTSPSFQHLVATSLAEWALLNNAANDLKKALEIIEYVQKNYPAPNQKVLSTKLTIQSAMRRAAEEERQKNEAEGKKN